MRLFLLGPPAAGKTTARSWIQAWAEDRGVALRDVGIEEAHRALLPGEERGVTYEIGACNELVLLEPERQIREAVAWLKGWIAAGPGSFLVELAHPTPHEIVAELPSVARLGAIALFVVAPRAVRLERNAARGRLRIPAGIVQAYPDELDAKALTTLSEAGVGVQLVSADGSLRDFRKRLVRALERASAADRMQE